MAKCLRCNNKLGPEDLLICEDCLPLVPEEVLELRMYYEIEIPFPTNYLPESDEYKSRVDARDTVVELISRIVKNPDKPPEEITYDYLGEMLYCQKLARKPDDIYMLENRMATIESLYTNLDYLFTKEGKTP